jgi:dTDP-3-amino-3,4,6-trideoxy-alpha-D-glucose transaminase
LHPIPVTDLGYLHRQQAGELEEAALRVLRSGRYLRGEGVEAFEREFAEHCGSRAAVAVGSGVDALRLSLVALGIGHSDEVIVPAHTAIATWLAITHAGARVLPVDADERTMLVDTDGVRAAVGPRTAAIVVVHLYGLVADMEPIARLAGEKRLALVEDAAQAHGARDGDRGVGTWGDLGAFSLYPRTSAPPVTEASWWPRTPRSSKECECLATTASGGATTASCSGTTAGSTSSRRRC